MSVWWLIHFISTLEIRRFEAIETLDPKKLFVFHINDAENIPKEQLTDAHRLYPGLGIFPIKEIKEKIR